MQVYRQGLGAWAVLGRGADGLGQGALVHRPTAACPAQQLVLGHLGAQRRQFKDLASLDSLVRERRAVADAAAGRAVVDDGVIDRCALAQGMALVSDLATHGALALDTQALGRGFGQAVAGWLKNFLRTAIGL